MSRIIYTFKNGKKLQDVLVSKSRFVSRLAHNKIIKKLQRNT